MQYYASVKAQCTIYVGDSSPFEAFNRVQAVANSLSSEVKIVARHYPELNDSQCIKELVRISEEPYVAFSGDDDFLVPNTLVKAAEFLEKNHDYRVANGTGLTFKLNNDGTKGKLVGTYRYRLESAHEPTAVLRLKAFLANYWVPLFSVHRKEEFFDDYTNIEKLSDKTFTELLPNCLSIAKGKAKRIEGLHAFRQVHEGRYFLPGLFDWLGSPKWAESFQIFRETIAEALRTTDNIKIEEARSAVDSAFSIYFAKHVQSAAESYKALEASEQNQLSIKTLRKGVARVYNRFGPEKKMRKAQLLKSGSEYHRDFMSLYEIVTDKSAT